MLNHHFSTDFGKYCPHSSPQLNVVDIGAVMFQSDVADNAIMVIDHSGCLLFHWPQEGVSGDLGDVVADQAMLIDGSGCLSIHWPLTPQRSFSGI
jgi:hypothetical protein